MAVGPNDRLIPVPIAGLDLGTDPKIVQRGMLKVENGYFPRKGTIEKRKGLASLTGAYDNNKFLVPYKDKPHLLGVDGLYTPDLSSATAGDFNKAGHLPLMDVGVEELAAAAGGRAYSPGIVQLDDVVCVTFLIVTDWATVEVALRAVTYSRLTGAVLDTEDIVAASTSTEVEQRAVPVILGSTIFIFYCNNSDELCYRTVGSDGAVASETVTAGLAGSSDFDADNRFLDVCVFGADSDIAGICYANVGNDMQVITVTEAEAVAEATPITATACQRVGCFRQSNTVFSVLYHDTNGGSNDGVYALGFDADALGDFSTTTFKEWDPAAHGLPLSLIGYATSDTTARVFVDYTGGSGHPFIEQDDLNTATPAFGGTGTPVNFRQDILIASKLFEPTFGDAQFLVTFIGHSSAPVSVQQSIYAITTGESTSDIGLVTASILPTRAGWFAYGVSNVHTVATDQWLSACGLSLHHTSDADIEGIAKLSISADPDTLDTAETLSALAIGSGLPQQFSGGLAVAEQGFLTYPEGVTATEHGSGTSLPAGTYGFKATYEYYVEGVRHESAPSPNISIPTETAKDIDVAVPTLGLSNKGTADDPIQIIIWRTVDNGSIWYRCGSADNDKSADRVTVQVTNTPSDDTLSTVDRQDPSEISAAAQRTLYTTGGVLEHTPPHPYRVSTVWQNRLFYVDRERESTTIFYSKEFIKGAGLAFSDVLRVDCTHEGGRIYALAVLDNRLLIFKEHSVYALQGAPLDDRAITGGFTKPYLLSSTIGCSEPRTLVHFPGGLAFMGPDGLFAIGHDANPVYIGQSVRHLTEVDALTITAAFVSPPESSIIWLSSEGTALIYNYRYNLWSTYSDHGAVSGCYCNGVYYLKNSESAGEAPVDASTIVLYRCDETGAGDDLIDATDNGWTGVATGNPKTAAPITGKIGGARAVTTAGAIFWTRAHDASVVPLTFTIAGWIRLKGSNNYPTWFFGKKKGSTSFTLQGGFVYVDSQMRASMQISEVGEGSQTYFEGTTTVTRNVWHYVGYTFDGAVGKVYLDGALETLHVDRNSIQGGGVLAYLAGYNWEAGNYVMWTQGEEYDMDEVYFSSDVKDLAWMSKRAVATVPSTVRALARSTALDGTSDIKQTVETGTLSFAGLGGWGRVKRVLLIGQARAGHTLRVKVAYNRETLWTDNETYDTTSADLLDSKWADIAEHYSMDSDSDRADKTFAIWVTLSRTKASAVRLQISDEDSVGAGFSLTAMAFLVSPEHGAEKVGLTRAS